MIKNSELGWVFNVRIANYWKTENGDLSIIIFYINLEFTFTFYIILSVMVKNWCWNYFDGDRKKAKCKYCPQAYVDGHVERMQKHLLVCKQIPAEIKQEIERKYNIKIFVILYFD